MEHLPAQPQLQLLPVPEVLQQSLFPSEAMGLGIRGFVKKKAHHGVPQFMPLRIRALLPDLRQIALNVLVLQVEDVVFLSA